MSSSSLSEYSFSSLLKSFPQTEKIWIAYSGGMDSSVLLHLVHENISSIEQSLEVVYVNHGLHEKSNEWAEFCRRQCKDYGVTFTQLDIKEALPKGCSIEAWAREQRYSLLAEIMNDNDLLLTAHHQDDQVETFFIQALRGGGPRGLASMPLYKKTMKGIHVRPLLEFRHSELATYAKEHELSWHDDPSNAETRYDRNYLRHKVLSIVEQRWPAYRETISRLVSHQQDYKVLLDEIGREDLSRVLSADTFNLQVDQLRKLSVERQKNILFTWIQERQLEPPGSKHIKKIISDLITADNDNAPCVNWKDVELRRYRNGLYASKRLVMPIENNKYEWNILETLIIEDEVLMASSESGTGVSKDKVKNKKVIVQYRQGGEKLKPHNKTHSKTVKQLFQERGVLPWLRDRFPLIYVDEELAVIPGLCIDKKYAADKDEPSWKIEWSGYNKAVQG